MSTAARQTAELQAWLTDKLNGRDWFNGESFGWADLSVAPYLNRSFHYGLGTPDSSQLARWRTRIRERPSVAATFKEFDAAAANMGDASGRLASGAIRREYRSSPRMDDEVGRRSDRPRRPRHEQHPLHLAAVIFAAVVLSEAKDLAPATKSLS